MYSSFLHIVAQNPCTMTWWCNPVLSVAYLELKLNRNWSKTEPNKPIKSQNPSRLIWTGNLSCSKGIVSDPVFNQLLLENDKDFLHGSERVVFTSEHKWTGATSWGRCGCCEYMLLLFALYISLASLFFFLSPFALFFFSLALSASAPDHLTPPPPPTS